MQQSNANAGAAGAQFRNELQFGDDLEFQSPMLTQVKRIWRGKAGDRSYPDFADFAPYELPFLLPFLHLYDIVDPGRAFWVRFQGTRVAAFNGVDLTGELITLSGRSRLRSGYAQCLDSIASAALPARIISTFGVDGEEPHSRTENFAALLTTGGDTPTMILVASETRGPHPH